MIARLCGLFFTPNKWPLFIVRTLLLYVGIICRGGHYMLQTVTIDWRPVEQGSMPRHEGNYLVAFDDGAVETYPMSDQDIKRGEVRDGQTHGLLWAEGIPSPLDNGED